MSDKKKMPHEVKIKIGEIRETPDFDRRLAQIYELAIKRYQEHNQNAEAESTEEIASKTSK